MDENCDWCIFYEGNGLIKWVAERSKEEQCRGDIDCCHIIDRTRTFTLMQTQTVETMWQLCVLLSYFIVFVFVNVKMLQNKKPKERKCQKVQDPKVTLRAAGSSSGRGLCKDNSVNCGKKKKSLSHVNTNKNKFKDRTNKQMLAFKLKKCLNPPTTQPRSSKGTFLWSYITFYGRLLQRGVGAWEGWGREIATCMPPQSDVTTQAKINFQYRYYLITTVIESTHYCSFVMWSLA